MRICSGVFVCVAVTCIGPVAGAEDSFYLTTKLASTSVEREIEIGPFDTVELDEDGWAAGVGYNFNRHLALQAEYLALGAINQTRVCGPPESLCLSAPPLETEIDALSMSIVSRLRLGPRASAFGKVGLARLETKASSLGRLEREADSLEGHFGAGLSLAVWRQLSLLAEYETAGSEVRSLSVGASFEF